MRASFFEFNIGSYGLFAAQQGLSVTSNNITNANTVGYSRQVITQQAGKALPNAGIGMVGTGVNVTGIERIRNSYLDTKMWAQKPILGEYRVKSEQLALIEGVFGEPSEVGFTSIFNDFFDSLDDLSKIPDEGERKVALMQNMKSFTQYFNGTASSLEKYQRDLNFEVKNKVDEINIISRRLES
ncbi:MAG TPA: flagellar hook-associated protein FlgK, partial [Epulopiscium sp.]|nr:flagellar hook-associated protein FlgK [Candidatus Epulonipiscium sp.]